MVLGSRFGEQVCRIAALGQQLWRIALGHNFGEQRRGTVLGSSIGVQLWTAFQTSWQLRAAATLGSSFPQHWGNSFGHNFVEQRRGTALGSSFEEQLCTAALKNCSFGEHHWGQLWGAAFGSRFGATALQRCFGEQLSEVGEQLTVGSNVAALQQH